MMLQNNEGRDGVIAQIIYDYFPPTIVGVARLKFVVAISTLRALFFDSGGFAHSVSSHKIALPV